MKQYLYLIIAFLLCSACELLDKDEDVEEELQITLDYLRFTDADKTRMKVWLGQEIERIYYSSTGEIDSVFIATDDEPWTLRFDTPGPYSSESIYSIMGGEKSIRQLIPGLGSYSFLSNSREMHFSRSNEPFLASGQPDISGTFKVQRSESGLGDRLRFERELPLPQNRKVHESFEVMN